MARRTETYTVADDNRDRGKTFIITELPAWDALRFCAKAVLALAQTGSELSAGALAKAAQGGP